MLLMTAGIHSEVDKSLSAVELNTRGYQLYEQKRYAESLDYFRAAFEKDPDYAYPHYNYACVLSLLAEQDEKKWGENEWEITEHLLVSMRLREKYVSKYFTDSDLKWYRKKQDTYSWPLLEYRSGKF
jgi:tetratricopeptide (TPR) repeat protein